MWATRSLFLNEVERAALVKTSWMEVQLEVGMNGVGICWRGKGVGGGGGFQLTGVGSKKVGIVRVGGWIVAASSICMAWFIQ